MKDWIVNEFFTFIEITNRRKAILLLPCLGMILFVLLDTWIQHLLLDAANKTLKSVIDFTPILVKHYEKMRRIAFFEIVLIGSFFWSIKEYIKIRKRWC